MTQVVRDYPNLCYLTQNFGEYGKTGYLHTRVKMTDQQEREIARRIEARLKERGEEHLSNDDHWVVTKRLFFFNLIIGKNVK